MDRGVVLGMGGDKTGTGHQEVVLWFAAVVAGMGWWGRRADEAPWTTPPPCQTIPFHTDHTATCGCVCEWFFWGGRGTALTGTVNKMWPVWLRGVLVVMRLRCME